MTAVLEKSRTKEIKINFELSKNNPRLTGLMESIRKYKINIDDLNENEINKLFECILIVSR